MAFNKLLLLGTTFCFGINFASASVPPQLTADLVISGVSRACSLATVGAVCLAACDYLSKKITNQSVSCSGMLSAAALLLLSFSREDQMLGALRIGACYVLGLASYNNPLCGVAAAAFSFTYPSLRENSSCGVAAATAAAIGAASAGAAWGAKKLWYKIKAATQANQH
jgi:hypothetical protein